MDKYRILCLFCWNAKLIPRLSMNVRLILSFTDECNINAIPLQIDHSIDEHDFLFCIVLENFGYKFIILIQFESTTIEELFPHVIPWRQGFRKAVVIEVGVYVEVSLKVLEFKLIGWHFFEYINDQIKPAGRVEIVFGACQVVNAKGLSKGDKGRLIKHDVNLAEIFHGHIKPSIRENDIV
jgi:hypothetical protein